MVPDDEDLAGIAPAHLGARPGYEGGRARPPPSWSSWHHPADEDRRPTRAADGTSPSAAAQVWVWLDPHRGRRRFLRLARGALRAARSSRRKTKFTRSLAASAPVPAARVRRLRRCTTTSVGMDPPEELHLDRQGVAQGHPPARGVLERLRVRRATDVPAPARVHRSGPDPLALRVEERLVGRPSASHALAEHLDLERACPAPPSSIGRYAYAMVCPDACSRSRPTSPATRPGRPGTPARCRASSNADRRASGTRAGGSCPSARTRSSASRCR